MTIYLAGGITGDENYKARFAAAKEWLLAEKETQEVARGLLKVSPYPTADVVLNPAELPEGWPGKVYMDVRLAMIRAADDQGGSDQQTGHNDGCKAGNRGNASRRRCPGGAWAGNS